MAQTQTNSSANGSKVMDFKPVDYDRDTLPPDAPAGKWEATCTVRKKPTNKDQYPMLILNYKLEETDDEENEHALGSEVADFLVFGPDTAKGSKQAKLRHRKVCEAFGVDLTVLPTGNLKSWDDLQELIDALDKRRVIIYTSVKTDPESGRAARTCTTRRRADCSRIRTPMRKSSRRPLAGGRPAMARRRGRASRRRRARAGKGSRRQDGR